MFSAVSLARHTRAQLTSYVCVLTPASVAVCVTPCYLRLSTEQRHASEEIVVRVSSLSLLRIISPVISARESVGTVAESVHQRAKRHAKCFVHQWMIMEEIGYAIVLLVQRHSSGAVTRNVTLPCPVYVTGAIETKYHTIVDETSTDYIDILQAQTILLVLIRIFC